MITQMFGIGRTHFVDLLRMSNETKNEISGILLAGGKARRMGGVNKGAQLLGGRTLAGLVIERMKPQVKSIFISSNEFAAEFDSYGYPVFKDVRQDYPGPLAGIETILKQDLGGPWYFVSPTDTPFLPRNLAGLLHKTAKEKQALCVGALELECEIDEGDFMNLNTLEELELLNKTLEQELSDGS